MRAMVLEKIRSPLILKDLPIPAFNDHQLLIKVSRCAVCRTDLHLVDGELPSVPLPIIPGHQIVGYVEKQGKKCKLFKKGDRVGVAWLGHACGVCYFCKNNQENLCDKAQFTGYQLNGGYAEYTAIDESFAYSLPPSYDDDHAAPLLCAGLIGFRAYRMVEDAKTIGFYGFGNAAHLLMQIAAYQKRKVFAFTRTGDQKTQQSALKMGAYFAGGSETLPKELLDAAIIFAPVGALIPQALKSVRKGGTVICAGIHMSDIPSFPYSLLWGEKTLKSVANLTREDGRLFLELAPKIPIKTAINLYTLEKANDALSAMRSGKIEGTAVIKL